MMKDKCLIRPRQILLQFLLFTILPAAVWAQSLKSLSGTVSDAADKSRLSGVSVSIKGTTRGVLTDADGQFKIQAKETDVLVFSFTGYKSKESKVSTQTIFDIVLAQSTSTNLNEVVVIGYGSVKKIDLTGSVAQVNMKDLGKAPVTSFAQALAGRMTGVMVGSIDGQPGSAMNIQIRGVGSLTQSTSPLFVIDGFPMENFDPNTINPMDIESINVLKDASSTAVYGSRGANGVIVIQTKRGKSGKAVITFNSSFGMQTDLKRIEMMSPYEFLKYQLEMNPTHPTTTAYFSGGRTLDSYKDSAGISMQDLILKRGMMRSHNLSIRGGNDQTKYSISGSLLNQDGVVLNTGYNRYTGRFSLDHTVSNKIKLGVTANYTGSNQFGETINAGTTSSTVPTSYIFSRMWMYRPISPSANLDLINTLVDQDLFNINTSDVRINPYIEMQNQYQYDISRILDANAYASYEIIPDLVFKSTVGARNQTLRQDRFYNSKTAQGGNNPVNTNGVNGSTRNSFVNSFFNSNTLNYSKTIHKKHKISAMGLFEVNGVNTSINGYSGRYLPNEALKMDGIDEGISYNPIYSTTANTMVSYGGRIDYNYNSKYILTGTFRADGSSKFTKANRWGYFPGAAFAWNINKEKFYKSIEKLVSSARIKASYGSNGNNRVGDFDTYNRLTQSIDGYSFFNGTPIGSVYISSISNPDLKWEKVSNTNFALELGFLKDRLTLSVELYRKLTNNLLLNANLPPTTGYTTANKNIGSLKNEGIEFMLNSINVNSKNFSWKSSFNISFNRNKILSLTSGQQSLATNVSYVSQYNQPLYLAQIGKPAGMMIGYVWDGVYTYDDFTQPVPGVYVLKSNVPSNGAARNTIMPGDIKYKDLNGDGIVNNYDVTFIGRGQPIHIGGFNNNLSYKNFTLNVFFQWAYGNNIYNANRLLMEGNSNNFYLINQYKSYVDRWSPENPTSKNYRARGNGPIGFHSSRVVEDGSYLRLKTLSLGYDLPAKLCRKMWMNNLNLSISAQNVFTWTKYTGLDPEVSTRNNVLSPGYDFSSYPQARTVVCTIIAEF